MKIITDYAQTKYNVTCGRQPVKYIVVHYTGTDASAKNNCIYFSGGNRNASADYFIDDSGVYQFNANIDGCYSWHCGDGNGRYGITNANSIGIEVVSYGRDFTQKEKDNLKELVTYLMNKYDVPKDRVVRHYDASRKQCPKPYVDNAKWNTLRDYITEVYEMVSDNDIAKIARSVWDYKIRDYQNFSKNPSAVEPAWEALARSHSDGAANYKELQRTDDTTGGTRKGKLTDRIPYIDARVDQTNQKVKTLEAKVNNMDKKLDEILKKLS